jgi:SPP1 gp7 family putative phage head morphogenesis protein
LNLSQKLAEIGVERQLDLNRLVGSYQNDLLATLIELADDIEAKIGARDLTGFSQSRINGLIKEIEALVTDAYGATFEQVQGELFELARDEAVFTLNSTNGLIGVDLLTSLAPEPLLRQIVKKDLLQGAPLAEWFKRQEADTQFRLTTAIRLGVAQGETNGQIIARLRGLEQTMKRDGSVMAATRRNLEALVRTGVQTVANNSRIGTFEANADVIKGLQQISTLDGRTSDICMACSGKQWTLKTKEPIGHSIPWNTGTPRHWNCRSTIISVLKSFKELGLPFDEFPESTRASMDGQVAQGFTFDDFLKKKGKAFQDDMLGAGRAELWRDGKITLSQLLDQQGNPLSLAQLRKKYE